MMICNAAGNMIYTVTGILILMKLQCCSAHYEANYFPATKSGPDLQYKKFMDYPVYPLFFLGVVQDTGIIIVYVSPGLLFVSIVWHFNVLTQGQFKLHQRALWGRGGTPGLAMFGR